VKKAGECANFGKKIVRKLLVKLTEGKEEEKRDLGRGFKA
jgi:ribosomal protein L13E